MEDSLKVKDRVTRKNINSFRYMQGPIGTIIEERDSGRFYIKWDHKASNGQQHSTIQGKFLKKVLKE